MITGDISNAIQETLIHITPTRHSGYWRDEEYQGYSRQQHHTRSCSTQLQVRHPLPRTEQHNPVDCIFFNTPTVAGARTDLVRLRKDTVCIIIIKRRAVIRSRGVSRRKAFCCCVRHTPESAHSIVVVEVVSSGAALNAPGGVRRSRAHFVCV